MLHCCLPLWTADSIGNVTLISTNSTMHCNADHHCVAPFSDLIWRFPEHYVEGCDIKMLLKDWTKLECAPLTRNDLYCREGEEKERIQTRLGQRTSPDGHKKAGTEPHPRCRTYTALHCVGLRCCGQNGCWSNGEGGLPAINWLPQLISHCLISLFRSWELRN